MPNVEDRLTQAKHTPDAATRERIWSQIEAGITAGDAGPQPVKERPTMTITNQPTLNTRVAGLAAAVLGVVLFGGLLAFLLNGSGGFGAGDSLQLEGTEWVLVELDGQPPLPDTQITLTFDDARLSGSSGCNSYGTTYTLEGSTLQVGEFEQTLMGCLDEGVVEQETQYMEVFSSVEAANMPNSDTLVLTGPAGSLTFERAGTTPDDMTQRDFSFIAELPADTVLVKMHYDGGLGGVPGANTPELILYADGRVAYITQRDSTTLMTEAAQLTPEQTIAFMEGLWAAGYPDLQSYTDECTPPDAQGGRTCVSDATTMVLNVRISADEVRTTRNYHTFAPDPAALAAVRAYLEDYTSPAVSDPPDNDAPPTDLAGTEWLLVTLNGEPALEETRVTLRFDEEQAGGYSGCNDYGGAYTLSGDGFAFPEGFARNEAGCGEAITGQETAYFTVLGSADSAVLSGDEVDGMTTLTIRGPEGTLTYRNIEAEALQGDPADLVDTYWVLRRWVDPFDEPLWEGDGLFWVRFNDDGTLAGFAGCRGFEGEYTIERGVIYLTYLGMLDDTCHGPESLLHTEGDFTTALGNNAGWGIDADGQLLWVTKPGARLTFEPQVDEPEPLAAPTESDLRRGTWVLVELNGAAPLGDEPLTLSFGPENAEGHTGCNSFSGLEPYDLDGTRIDLWEQVSFTEMGCSDELARQEERYLMLLGGVRTIYMVGDDTLVLSGPSGTLTFERLSPP